MTAARVAALLEERRGYLARGRSDRVAQVDAELARLGYAADDRKDPAVPAEADSDVETTARRPGERRRLRS